MAAKQPKKVQELAAPLVRVDGRNRRSDEDALEGCFVDIVAGDYAGRRGSFESVVEHGSDGYPASILVRTRDSRNELISVDYADARPASEYNGGR